MNMVTGAKALHHVAGSAKGKQLEQWTRYDAEEGHPLTTNTGVKVSNDEVTLSATGNGKQGYVIRLSCSSISHCTLTIALAQQHIDLHTNTLLLCSLRCCCFNTLTN